MADSRDGASDECRKDLGELLAREEALIRELEFFHLRDAGRQSLKRRLSGSMRAPALLVAAVLLAAAPAAGAPERNPHDFQQIGCTHCHVLVPGQGRVLQRNVFRKDIDDLCQECHAASLEDNINHRVGIRPSMKVPEDLHLNEKGEISCITCHDPHAEYVSAKTGNRTWFLRRQMLKRELCLACHAEENYQEPKTTITLLAPANNAVVDRLPVPLIGTVSDARLAEVTAEINDSRLVLSVAQPAPSRRCSRCARASTRSASPARAWCPWS